MKRRGIFFFFKKLDKIAGLIHSAGVCDLFYGKLRISEKLLCVIDPERYHVFIDRSTNIRYETDFVQTEGQRLLLMLGEAYESVSVWVNGILVGERICPPYSFEVPGETVRDGKNRLIIEVTNTLAKAQHDNEFDRFWVQDPSGLLGPVRIIAAPAETEKLA